MVATGQPVTDIEHELAEVATRLGYPDAQIAGGPTGLHVTLASGAPSTFESVKGPLRLDQAVDVRAIRAKLAYGVLSVEEGVDRVAGPPVEAAALPDLAGQPGVGRRVPRYRD